MMPSVFSSHCNQFNEKLRTPPAAQLLAIEAIHFLASDKETKTNLFAERRDLSLSWLSK